MGKIAAKVTTISFNSVALEDEIDDWSLDIQQETPVVTALADPGPRRVAGNYDFGASISGKADFAAGQGDATLFALIGSAGVAMAIDPTGQAASADEPNYDATSVVLSSYGISGGVGQPVTYSAKLEGNSALARSLWRAKASPSSLVSGLWTITARGGPFEMRESTLIITPEGTESSSSRLARSQDRCR